MTEKQKLIQRRVAVQNLLEYARSDGDVTGEIQCEQSLKEINARLGEIYQSDPGRESAMRREVLTDKLRKQL